MGRLKPIPQLKNGGNGLPKTGIGGKNNRAASIPNKPGDKAIGNGSKPQDIAKDMRDKVGEAVKNLNSPNEQPQELENIEEPMPDPGSLIDEIPQQSLAGSLNNPGSLNAGNGGLGGDGNNGKDKNGKKKKTPMDKLKGKVKRAIIQAILSHLMPIFIGVMAFGAIGSCSAAMFTGGDNTEIEQTRGQNKKIVINGSNNDVCADDGNHDSDGNYSLGGDNHKELSSDPADEWGKKIFGYYKSKGYSDAAAAAVCGNMFIESNYSTASDNGSHHGLCQWDSEHRYPALSKWAKENNMDPEDFKAQVEYSEKELTDTYLQNMGDWKNSTNVAEATTTYLNIFEGASGQATQDRIDKAQIVMDAFSGKVSGSSTLSSSTKSKVCDKEHTFDSGDWVYYNQNKASETWNTKYPSHPWGSSCGIVSFAMVARNYSGDDKYNPDWAVENGFSVGGVGDATVNQTECLNYINSHEDIFHLKGELVSNPAKQSDFQPVIDACKSGGCAVMYIFTTGHVKLDWSGGAGFHWIVVRDVDESSDTATIADVAIGKESKVKWSELSNPSNICNLSNGIFAFTSTVGKRSFSSNSDTGNSDNNTGGNNSSANHTNSRKHQLIQ